jgi:hypothetical protein
VLVSQPTLGSRRARLGGFVLAFTAAALVFGGLSPTVAFADGPRADKPVACPIHGHVTEGDTTDLVTVTHGNTQIDTFTHPLYFDGAFSPVGAAQERDVTNLLTGIAKVHVRISYSGSVRCDDGRVLGVGGLEINFVATANFVTNTFAGRFQIIGSSGGLEGTHGHGVITGVPGVPGGNGPYIGTLHLGPSDGNADQPED